MGDGGGRVSLCGGGHIARQVLRAHKVNDVVLYPSEGLALIQNSRVACRIELGVEGLDLAAAEKAKDVEAVAAFEIKIKIK